MLLNKYDCKLIEWKTNANYYQEMSQITLNVFCYLNVQIEPEQSLETSLPEVTIWYSLIP